MSKCIPSRDQVHLVPVVMAIVAPKALHCAEGADEPWSLAFFGAHNLASIGDNAAGAGPRFRFLAVVIPRVVEIELVSTEIPLHTLRSQRTRRCRCGCGSASLARSQKVSAVLYPAIGGDAFHFDLQLQFVVGHLA